VEVRLRWSPSLVVVGGSGRVESGESSERCRTRGVFAGVRVSCSDVLEALCDGGPTKSAGAGRRLVCVFVIFLSSLEAMMVHALDVLRETSCKVMREVQVSR
jgi:hypothetical protein